MLRSIIHAGVALSLVSGANAVAADDFPARAVTIIVPYSAGGGTDSFARALEAPLEQALGTDVVIRNVAGGGGAVGYMQTLAAKPDGYTVTVPLNAIYTLIGMGNVGFQIADFDFLGKLVEDPYVLAVGRSDRWSDLESFVAASRNSPVTLGVAGVGSSGHIMTMAMVEALGLNANLIPYDGNAAASAAVMGGHIDGVVLQPSDAVGAIEGGDGLIPLATTAPSALMPSVPLFTDFDVDLATTQWRGIAAPAGLAPEVISAWEDALKTAIQDESFRTAVANLGLELKPVFGEELQDFVKSGEELFIPLSASVVGN